MNQEIQHAKNILLEARRYSANWSRTNYSIFDMLQEAQEYLRYSDGCRQLATRLIVRSNDITSLSAWEDTEHISPLMVRGFLSSAVLEANFLKDNPYKGFIFCTCMQLPQPVLMEA